MTDKLPNRPDHDGIQEHDNFLPRWWLATLFGAILFSAVYWFYYQTTGTGPSQREQLERAEKQLAALREKAGGGGATDGGPNVLLAAVNNPEAIKRGADLFATNCVACHGAQGQGNIGPNLTDAFWIHGKKPEEIQKVITGGVSDKGMPAWGPSLGPAKVADAVAFVLSISNKNVPGKAPQGEKVSP